MSGHWAGILLLALACLGQGTYFARLARLRLAGTGREPGPFALAVLFCGGACGLAFAVLRRDAVFFLGQACVLVLAAGWARRRGETRDRTRGGSGGDHEF
ncbi:MAG: hypothetical protein JW718_08835 [Desulfovibrionaceae bacterium]|nr:hypothetical protein [Desulfovibrionaceae bacterium]